MRVALQTAMEFIMPFKCRLLRKPIDVCRTRMRGRYIYIGYMEEKIDWSQKYIRIQGFNSKAYSAGIHFERDG